MSKNKKLIVFTHGGGRFTNQLISYSHLIAFILENQHEFDLINMAFWPYAHLLEMTSSDLLCRLPTQHNRWRQLENLRASLNALPAKLSVRARSNSIRVLYAYGTISPGIQTIIAKETLGFRYCFGKKIDGLDLANFDDISLLNQAKITFLAGWGIRSWSLFKKYQPTIIKYLAIRKRYTDIAKNFVESLRNKYDFLIGILIRQGDYRKYKQGRYFFETEQYIRWMVQAKEIFSTTSSKIGFIVASDEPQEWEKFKDLNVHFATGIAGSQGHYAESMAELSQCDMVMTPPSTFGVWAAFVGNIPILPLYKTSQTISKANLLNNHIFDAIVHPHLSVAVK